MAFLSRQRGTHCCNKKKKKKKKARNCCWDRERKAWVGVCQGLTMRVPPCTDIQVRLCACLHIQAACLNFSRRLSYLFSLAVGPYEIAPGQIFTLQFADCFANGRCGVLYCGEMKVGGWGGEIHGSGIVTKGGRSEKRRWCWEINC